MHEHPQRPDFGGRARRLVAKGRTQWRRTRARLERLATPRRLRPGAGGPETPNTDDPEHEIEVAGDGQAVLATRPHQRLPLWLAGGFALLVAAIALLIAIWDWDWFRGPVARYASARTHRTVRIDGHLKAHILTFTPQVWVTGLKIGNPKWAGPGDVADVPSLTIKAKLMPLFAGRLDLPLVEIDRPDLNLYSDAQGRANWKGDPNDDKAAALPPIQRLIVRDGKVKLRDVKRKLTLDATVNTSEDAPGSGRGVFRLEGQGSLNSDPFLLRVTGAPLIDVKRDQPYRFNADLKAGATHIAARGQIDKPFDFGRYHANLAISGANLARLYDLTGVAFPTTPAYQATGLFSRDHDTYRYQRFAGRVGASDLSGNILVGKRKARRYVSADLISRSLDWKDLAAVTGGAPAAPKGASPALQQAAQELKSKGRVVPDAEINLDKLRSLDADVKFRATAVQANRLKLSRVNLGVKLDHAVLTLNPLSFTFAQGVLDGHTRTDARKPVPVTDIDLRLSNYALQSALPMRGGAPPATGIIDGEAHLHGAGRSLHQALAASDGRVRFVAPRGEIRQAFAELLGINVGKGLSLLLNKDQHKTDLRCAVADFNVAGGTMQARQIVIDTGVVVSHGSGSINLGSETMNLRLEGQSKKPRLLRLWAPITVKGQFSHPQLGVEQGAVAAQGGVAAALGALVHPLAVILPFVTPGGAKDVDCSALIAGRLPPQPAPAKGR